MSAWEERMSARAKARRAAEPSPSESPAEQIPRELCGELPSGEPDIARDWCTSCGLPDPPQWGKFDDPVPCLRCGSLWRWHGRLCDRDGTATSAPDDGLCRGCYEWRRYSTGQEHFGWSWWRTCDHNCGHEHHKSELWLASA